MSSSSSRPLSESALAAYREIAEAAKVIRIENHCDYLVKVAAFERMDNALHTLHQLKEL